MDLDPIVCFENVTVLVAEECAVNPSGGGSQENMYFNLLVEVLLEDGVGIDEIGFVVLLKYGDIFRTADCFEADCFCLYIG